MDYTALAELLFPAVTETPEEVHARFPKRDVPEGAVVTRMAPSPTGFVHLGNLVQGMISERMAHQSGGVLFLRVEDTDAKREVPGAVEVLINSLKHYNINFDVGAKSEIYNLMDVLAKQGKSIIMISSELAEVLRMSDRILVMCEGRKTGELDIAEATQENIMKLATMREEN